MKKGILFVVSGPSGVGKKTILDQIIFKKELNIKYSISMTTRPKRQNEENGVDYFFVNKEEFQKEILKNNFLEYAEFFNNYYGTPKSYVEEQLALGKNIILEIEVIGAEIIMKNLPEAISIFILPPSIEELRKRLIKRGTETIDLINIRLQKAELEIAFKNKYKYNVINDDQFQTANEIANIILKEIALKNQK